MTSVRLLNIAHNVQFDYDLRPLSTLKLDHVYLDSKKTYLGVEALQCKVHFT